MGRCEEQVGIVRGQGCLGVLSKHQRVPATCHISCCSLGFFDSQLAVPHCNNVAGVNWGGRALVLGGGDGSGERKGV